MDLHAAARWALVLGGALGGVVALARRITLDRAASADPKALGGATLGLHLGHDCPPCIGAAGGGTLPRFRPEDTLSTNSMLLFRPEDHDHLTAFQLGPLLHYAHFLQLPPHPLQELHP